MWPVWALVLACSRAIRVTERRVRGAGEQYVEMDGEAQADIRVDGRENGNGNGNDGNGRKDGDGARAQWARAFPEQETHLGPSLGPLRHCSMIARDDDWIREALAGRQMLPTVRILLPSFYEF